MVSAWRGGMRPGLVTTGASTVALLLLFLLFPTVRDAEPFFRGLKLTEKDAAIADKVLREIEPYKPRILKTSLTDETEQRLKAELSKAA